MKVTSSLLAAFAIVVFTFAQEKPKTASARDMYFGGIEAPVVRTARRKPAPAKKRPALGLRYSVLQAKGAGLVEVPVNTVFHSGDRIQLKIRPNEDGFMYVVHQGTSGDWYPMFPHPKRDMGSNRVEAGKDYVVPPQLLRFSGKPGIEKLFVIMTRTPEPSIDRILYRMRNSGDPAPPAAGGSPPVLMASNAVVSNSLIENMRRTYTRDLVFDDAGDTPGAASETTNTRESAIQDTATYVVNTSTQPEAHVLAEIQLTHR